MDLCGKCGLSVVCEWVYKGLGLNHSFIVLKIDGKILGELLGHHDHLHAKAARFEMHSLHQEHRTRMAYLHLLVRRLTRRSKDCPS